MAHEPKVFTLSELGDTGDPPYDSRVPIALQADSPEDFEMEMIRLADSEHDAEHDEHMAQMILAMEAAGVPGDQIVDMLVDELARGEQW